MFVDGVHMRTGRDRVAGNAMQVSESDGGARLAPGDFMRCDRDGVVVVPRERMDQVPEAATRIPAAEDSTRAAVERGERLDTARNHQGHHALQTKGEP